MDGLGGKVNGTPREDGFDITVASEVMAIFCLATSISDLKERLSKIVCAYTYEGKPVTAGDIGAAGAMTALLKDALDPNLVQTLENNPAIIHGGPFANIAHGCNSVRSRMGTMNVIIHFDLFSRSAASAMQSSFSFSVIVSGSISVVTPRSEKPRL